MCAVSLHDTFGLTELVSTEFDYLESLRRIVDGYFKPIKSCVSPPELKQHISVIFGNIFDIYMFHHDFFYPELQQCSTISDLCHCFISNLHNFNMYALYCANKYESSRFLHSYHGSFFQDRQNFLKERFSLEDLLIAPIQRLSQYHLLLKNIQLHCNSDVQISALQSAKKHLKDLPMEANNNIYLGMIKDYIGSFNNHGILLYHGNVKGAFSDVETKRPFVSHDFLSYYIFLFDLSLIVTRIDKTQYSYVCSFRTCAMRVLVSPSPSAYDIFAILSDDVQPFPRMNIHAFNLFDKQKWISILYNLSLHHKEFSSSVVNPSSSSLIGTLSIDEYLDETNTIVLEDEFRFSIPSDGGNLPSTSCTTRHDSILQSGVLPSNKSNLMNPNLSGLSSSDIFVVVSDIDSALYDGIDCIALKARDIVRVLYQSLSNFSFIRTFKNKEFVEGWIPTSRLVVPQLTTNSDSNFSLLHEPFVKLDHEWSNFVIDRLISKGVYSLRYKCLDKNDLQTDMAAIAMKVRNIHRVFQIAELSYIISHDNLEKFLGLFRDGGRLLLLFTNCGDIPLFSHLATMQYYTETNILVYMSQLWKGMKYLHFINIAHLDIRPENIYLSKMNHSIKLIDYTCSQVLTDVVDIGRFQQLKNISFLSPEQVIGSNVTYSADQWASGVVMYILLSGYYPFGGNSENETRSKVLTASYSFAYSTFLTISKASKMCIGSLLEVDPAARLSAAQCLLAVSSSDVVKLKSKVISSKPLKDYLVHRYMQIQLT